MTSCGTNIIVVYNTYLNSTTNRQFIVNTVILFPPTQLVLSTAKRFIYNVHCKLLSSHDPTINVNRVFGSVSAWTFTVRRTARQNYQIGGGRGNNKYRHVYNIRKKIKRRSKIGRSVSDFIQLFVEVSVRVHILYAERVINYTRNRFRVKYTLGEHRTHIIIIILCACTHYIYIFILHVLCGYSAYLRERCTCSAGKV